MKEWILEFVHDLLLALEKAKKAGEDAKSAL